MQGISFISTAWLLFRLPIFTFPAPGGASSRRIYVYWTAKTCMIQPFSQHDVTACGLIVNQHLSLVRVKQQVWHTAVHLQDTGSLSACSCAFSRCLQGSSLPVFMTQAAFMKASLLSSLCCNQAGRCRPAAPATTRFPQIDYMCLVQ